MRYLSLTSLLSLALAFTVAASALAGCGPVCDLDAHGRQLTFPYPIVTATVFATTTNIIYFRDPKGSQIISTAVRTVQPRPAPTFTWRVSGVVLTYPTTYVIYTSFVHSYVVGEECQTRSLPLKVGNMTNYASLIYPAASVTGTLPPAFLINYLESIPTVYRQLGGPVNSSCDPVTSSTSSSTTQPGVISVTTTDVVPIATITSQTVSISSAFDTSGSSLSMQLTVPRFSNTTTPRTTTTTTTTTTPNAGSKTSTTKTSLSVGPISSSLTRGASSGLSSALSDLSSSIGQTSAPQGSQSTTSGSKTTTSGSSSSSGGGGGGGFSNAAAQVNIDTAGAGFGCTLAAFFGIALWLL